MELPNLFDLIFKRKKEHSDDLCWSVLQWILDLDKDFVEKIRGKDHFKKLSTTIITLQYLVQVLIKFCNSFVDFFVSNPELLTERRAIAQ